MCLTFSFVSSSVAVVSFCSSWIWLFFSSRLVSFNEASSTFNSSTLLKPSFWVLPGKQSSATRYLLWTAKFVCDICVTYFALLQRTDIAVADELLSHQAPSLSFWAPPSVWPALPPAVESLPENPQLFGWRMPSALPCHRLTVAKKEPQALGSPASFPSPVNYPSVLGVLAGKSVHLPLFASRPV